MKRLFLIFIFSFFHFFIIHCFAQSQLRMLPCNALSTCKRYTLFHETNTDLKKFNYNSVNLEYLLSCNPTHAVGLQIGIIYYSFPKISAMGIPLGLNFIFGRSYNLLDIGFGATYMHVSKNYSEPLGKYDDNISYAGLNAHISFRHQVTEGGLFYRIGFTPMLSILNYKNIPIIADKVLIPMAGIAIGWTFK
jgi:hypothetical protein